MNATPLILKNPKGWFAAGAEIEKALTLLSDGAFKLFVYLCLNARRDTGGLETTQTELARGLHKGTASIRSYLREMVTLLEGLEQGITKQMTEAGTEDFDGEKEVFARVRLRAGDPALAVGG